MKHIAKKLGASDAIGVLRELEDIKRLLMLALLRDGVSQGDIAKALGVSQPTISRMFPGKIGAAVERTASRRVAPGSRPPGGPTDPDKDDSGIPLLWARICFPTSTG